MPIGVAQRNTIKYGPNGWLNPTAVMIDNSQMLWSPLYFPGLLLIILAWLLGPGDTSPHENGQPVLGVFFLNTSGTFMSLISLNRNVHAPRFVLLYIGLYMGRFYFFSKPKMKNKEKEEKHVFNVSCLHYNAVQICVSLC